MSHQFEIIARDVPGSLERILRTVRVRGFELLRLNMERENGEPLYCRLHLQVEGERCPQMLERQLRKLVDVRQAAAVAEPGVAMGECAVAL